MTLQGLMDFAVRSARLDSTHSSRSDASAVTQATITPLMKALISACMQRWPKKRPSFFIKKLGLSSFVSVCSL